MSEALGSVLSRNKGKLKGRSSNHSPMTQNFETKTILSIIPAQMLCAHSKDPTNWKHGDKTEKPHQLSLEDLSSLFSLQGLIH